MVRVVSILSAGVLALFLVVVPMGGHLSFGATPTDQESVSAPPSRGNSSSEKEGATECTSTPLVMPETPAVIPGYTELDPTTGLHVTGGIQEIDVKSYRLTVTGKVRRSLSLSYDDLRCMGRIEARPTLICLGFFSDVARWAGVPLKTVLDKAGLLPGIEGIRLIGADKYISSLPIDIARKEGYFLAYEWEGKALPRLHGFPVRGVFPDQEGNRWVKWLVAIEVY
jgi:DMSO/TMAO reductase YedYZ molybdopterin-dependent catalytic subunit